MGEQQDIRWLQRFDNYQRALKRLQEAKDLADSRKLTDLEQQGLIQGFEFTHELAWNTLKDFLTYRGISNIIGSRDATRGAFRYGLVKDGEAWMEMIKSRNLTSHTYREEVANEIADKILNRYFQAFVELKSTLQQWVDEQGEDNV
ncbi:MAG: nucleotidyltransferase substrate binding protein [Endozoicomonas sp.]